MFLICSTQCDQIRLLLNVLATILPQIFGNFWAVLKTVPFETITAVACCATFGQYWATLFSNVWYHWFDASVVLVRIFSLTGD